MNKEIINLKLRDGRVVQFLNMDVKLFETFEDYRWGKNFRYAAEEDYNNAVAHSEIKLYYLLSQANIQNPEVLTETEKNIIQKFFDAFGAVDDQYTSFDSSVDLINQILETVFCGYVNIW